MNQYMKMIVAAVGAAVTTVLGVIPDSSTLWIILTAIAAALTTLGVYAVPNTPAVKE